MTQLAPLRLLSTRPIVPGEPLTSTQAWQIHDELASDERAVFLEEPHGLEDKLRYLTMGKTTTGKTLKAGDWADFFLASLSSLTGFALVTFDDALAKRTEHSILL